MASEVETLGSIGLVRKEMSSRTLGIVSPCPGFILAALASLLPIQSWTKVGDVRVRSTCLFPETIEHSRVCFFENTAASLCLGSLVAQSARHTTLQHITSVPCALDTTMNACSAPPLQLSCLSQGRGHKGALTVVCLVLFPKFLCEGPTNFKSSGPAAHSCEPPWAQEMQKWTKWPILSGCGAESGLAFSGPELSPTGCA
eukprot:3836150-Amphidinium_carterae.1